MMNRMMKKAAVLLGAAAMAIAGMTCIATASAMKEEEPDRIEEIQAEKKSEKSVLLGDYTDELVNLGWLTSDENGSGLVGKFEMGNDGINAIPLSYVVPTNGFGQKESSFHVMVLGDDVVDAAYFPYINEDGVKQDDYVTFAVPTETGRQIYYFNNITGEIIKRIPEQSIRTEEVTNGERELCVNVAHAIAVEYYSLLAEVQAMAD